ncbi:MAG: FAD-dependent 5-carboxymethylaminomethyl-2-thiouridine(34) oxidoreductase MnmC [Alphaproteobacteria bacterium]|jgi:tRNA 5-methylaminomethyl-2-thiouridine biosynthesis bifunctional protein|nr:FAD-dependent 5-carboxymethylaminomethyl-2-thiouridine(34) oxidoreductase MnmC [Alphaproteobacteria bacterium]
MKVAIIGAGLAGTACAWALRQAGAEPVIYEAGPEIAPGASGNPLGLYNPRLSAERSFYSDAFPLALKAFQELRDTDWNECGALHLITDEKRQKKFIDAVKSWGWPRGEMRIVPKAEASAIAGVSVNYDALYLARSGTISPKKLCKAYASAIPVKLNTPVTNLVDVQADAIIVAAGMATKNLPLRAVRGQITFVKATKASEKLKCNLCYGGYFSPAKRGEHALGATFQRWLDHDQIIGDDDYDNIEKLVRVAPELAEGLEIVGQRAAVRTTSPDHFPVIGHLRDNIYVSTGHGSHGIISSIGAAHILTNMIMERPLPFPAQTIQKISPGRFSK